MKAPVTEEEIKRIIKIRMIFIFTTCSEFPDKEPILLRDKDDSERIRIMKKFDISEDEIAEFLKYNQLNQQR